MPCEITDSEERSILNGLNWQEVKYASTFDNVYSPPGSMSGFETTSVIYVVGKQSVIAKDASEARSLTSGFLEKGHEEPLIHFIPLNTHSLNITKAPRVNPIYGLTQKV
ncbi:MAG: hypothetical protein AABX85_01840 [Nanoarchaeota archaeon]